MPPEKFIVEKEPPFHRGIRIEGDDVYIDRPCQSDIDVDVRQLGTLSVDNGHESPIVRLTLGRHTLDLTEAFAFFQDMHAGGAEDIRFRRPHGLRHAELAGLQSIGAKATMHDKVHPTRITEVRLFGPPSQDLRAFDSHEREAA